MTQYRFDFLLGHGLQQAGADRDQRIVLVPAGGKGVGSGLMENADIRLTDARLARLSMYRLDQPAFGGVGGLLDQLHIHRPNGSGLAHGQ